MKKHNVGIILSYGSTGLNMVCGLLLSSYLLRMLGDIEYGLYQTIASFSTYLVLLEFGIGTVMTRNILVHRNSGEDHKIKNTVSTLWSAAIVLGLLILVVSICFCASIGAVYRKTMTAEQIPYAKWVFLVMTVYLIASFLKQAIGGVLLGMENYTFLRILDIVRILLRTALLICIIYFQPFAIIIAVIDAAISVICFMVTYIYITSKYGIPIKFKYFDRQILKQAVPMCVALLLQTVVNQVNNSVDKFLIGIMISMEGVAVYSVAQYVYSMFSSLTTIPITMYMPQVAKSIGDGLQGKELTRTLVKPCRLIVLIGGMICGGFFAVGKQFVEIVYGAQKLEAWSYALILMIPMFINMASGIIINILDVTNKRLVRSWVLMGTTGLNVVLTVLALPRYGIIGAVVATAISTLLGQVLIMNIYYSKALGLKMLYLYRETFRGILGFILLGAIVAYFAAKLIRNAVAAFILGGVVFVLLSLGGFIVCNYFLPIIRKRHNRFEGN